ncbi:MAG: CPBP family intramembrane metalloprotease [Bacteroidia bacterium]|nr:CPBP family intramembrane metalloprotease [Bacteroidia bacterium]
MNRIILAFCGITFFITWGITLTSYFLYRHGTLSLDQLNLIYNLGALGPFIGAIACAAIFYGNTGIKKLFSTLSFKNLNRKSLLISSCPLLFFVLGMLIYPLFTGKWYTFKVTQEQFHLSSTISYAGWILPFITYSVFEEFGWRGFLLPHLQEKNTAFKATVFLTLIWASWHLPFFLWRFQFSLFISFGFFFAIFIGAILLTSAFNFSKGSIISTILFHFANNLTSALEKEYTVVVVSVCFVFVAMYITGKFGKENLASENRIKNFYKEVTEKTNLHSINKF